MKQYPSKVILFGEYSVVMGSQVLGIPIFDSYGYWSDESGPNSDLSDAFIDYLRLRCNHFLDPQRITQLADGQIKYRSTIKQAYGMGSSGALSAAIYDYCAKEPVAETAKLQHYLSEIESFFHGQSSGFDPLISIRGCPVVRKIDGTYQLLTDEVLSLHASSKIHLLDSGDERSVKGLVPKFVSLYKDQPNLYATLSLINNTIIETFLSGDDITTWIAELSQFQLDNMSPMIMKHLIPFWKQGLRSGDYYVKICGSGGGGYYQIYIVDEKLDFTDWPYQLTPVVRS